MNTIRNSLKALAVGTLLLGAAQANAKPEAIPMGPGGSLGVRCGTRYIQGKHQAAEDPAKNTSFSSDRTSVTVNCRYSDSSKNESRGPFECQSSSGAAVEITVGPFKDDHGDWVGQVRCTEKKLQK